ncbi:MAG TPA: VIT and VWA domain-containing protein [Longimicrobium sp.]|jgi:Ca-activated chloride channel family protein|uniref:VIT and vWA domain-containing protein n=1 Tax=Longimicrobium sp. TaxID=2029185 RepID=UPI002EDB201C
MKLLRGLLPALVALACTGVELRAQGVIVPAPCRECRRPPPGDPAGLPVESVTFETTIQGQVATTHVTQVFRNPHPQVMEGTYFFPLPEEASITEFAIWDGDRRLEGEVRPRDEARRIYEDIVRRVRDPGLLEYAGQNLFQARIFPIPGHGTKKLELTYTQVLRAENGTVGYRYPLGIGRNASRIERLAGRVQLRTDGGLRTVYSPTHDVDVRRDGGRGATVSLEQGPRSERRDFQLFYALSQAEVGMSLFTYREPGKDGYFLLLLSPSDDDARREYPAKDVVFVLDVSGSMEEEGKMEKARRALLYGIRGLRAGDRFNVIAFSGDTRLMESGLIAADEAGRWRGVAFVEGLDARGGTNINDALVEAMGQFPRESTRPRLLVFMTDGLPTVSETNVDRIIQNVTRARREGLRLFTFGVGYDVNTRLLDRVAAENGGTADYVAPQEDLEVKVSGFFDKVNHPVLTNLRLDLGPVRTELMYPRALPDLFKGTQLALVGRYRNEQDLRDVTIRLSGNASPTRTYTYDGARFPLRDERHEFLPRLWATRRVGWLMEQIRTHGENRELVDEVTDLGTRFGIVTPYTSFLALEPGMQAANAQDFSGQGVPGTVAGGRVRPSTRPRTEQAAGASPPPPPPPPPPPTAPLSAAPTVVTGQGAVTQSQRSREQQDALTLDEIAVTGESTVQRVGTRTFYLRGGVWTDAEIREDTRLPETAVTFGSEEYFALIRRVPALAQYLALGEQVAVIHDGRIYRVRAATQ